MITTKSIGRRKEKWEMEMMDRELYPSRIRW
jgi:hypothetical protein